MKRRQLIHLTALVVAATLLTPPPAAEAGSRRKHDKAAAPASMSSPVPAGPKQSIAVARFATKSDFLRQYGQTDVGGGLAAMLANALTASGRFIVVERATLSDALTEQELKSSGLVNDESGPALGNLFGADLLVQGAVTEFSQAAKGGGFGIGISGGGLLKRVGLAPQFRRGTVGIDLRIVDTTTGQIVASHSVVETVKSKALRLTVDVDDVSLSQNAFSNTPLGKAARGAIERAVEHLIAAAANRPWSGRVVEFAYDEVVINAGSSSGIDVGDSFAIERTTRVLTDPDTGRVLGHRRATLGTVVIADVEDELAFGRFEAASATPPQRGDRVVPR